MTVLHYLVRAAGGTAVVTLVASSGMPALGALIFTIASVLAIAGWVIASPDRSERICRILLAGRGDPRCLPSGSSTLAAVPAHSSVSQVPLPAEKIQRLQDLIRVCGYQDKPPSMPKYPPLS